MSSLNPDEDQKWVPTHVQVTVLKGRRLRGKGKNGTSDVYTIIQLGKEKYSTCVAEKTTEPEWREECTFELQPGALESGTELVLTVMHRALIGLDVFLGQAVIPLDKVFTSSRGVKNDIKALQTHPLLPPPLTNSGTSHTPRARQHTALLLTNWPL
ncbi:hypothetical protein WMY93_016739 [Mugilogobius chulae]|uniref:C2 domain-containing protein n=1 Tax=Mugilogobius chulae TaxID=88201 RepID=A0AAW0NR47_9GOBI